MPDQHSTHIDHVIGPVHTGSGDIHIHYTRPPLGTPFQAPPLPFHFVPRPDASDALKARLLAEETTTPGILVVSAIHGLGPLFCLHKIASRKPNQAAPPDWLRRFW